VLKLCSPPARRSGHRNLDHIPEGRNKAVYIPEHFRSEDQAAALAFMRANPFAILISTKDSEPFASHIPVVIREQGGQIKLRGHVAKANPHWRYMGEQPRCLLIFHGPHAYISPSNYETRENVPTWNYGAVHAYGEARTFSEIPELLNMLDDLIPTFEAAYAEQWSALSESYRTRMLGHIVGFEIVVSRLEAKFKLSQNRTRQEQQNVIESLSHSSDTTVSGTAELMCEHALGTKAQKKSKDQ
jgi:transcriptional regulator